MDIAASVRNLFKKRDFKDEIEKSLGEDRNFETVLTDVFAVYAKSGFFNRADWEETIIKSIGNVYPLIQSELHVRPNTDSAVDDVEKADIDKTNIDNADIGKADVEALSRSQSRRNRLKVTSVVARRSERVKWQAERYTYN